MKARYFLLIGSLCGLDAAYLDSQTIIYTCLHGSIDACDHLHYALNYSGGLWYGFFLFLLLFIFKRLDSE